MIKQHSWTRREYEFAYGQMRRGFSFDDIYEGTEVTLEIVKAADYSYQASNYEVHGWSNDQRRKRFSSIFWRVVTARGELPF